MESNNTMDMLEESIFFEARKARLPSNGIEELRGFPSLFSTQYHSVRIYNMMEHLKGMDLSEVDFAFEASKDHWTELESKYDSAMDLLINSHMKNTTKHTHDESTWVLDFKSVSGRDGEATNKDLELYEENVAFIKSLQREDPVSNFFQIDGVDGEWILGRKIGEGGQATIYEVNEYIGCDGRKWTSPVPFVLKVFNVGYSLFDLRKQWPLTLLHKLNPRFKDFYKRPYFCKPINHGRLLKDGRFAFEMGREWGDLRKLLDVRMQHNGNQHPPFMMLDGNYLDLCMLQMMRQIAYGMRGMHKEGTLHRDLKASNVLISGNRMPLDDPSFESIFVEGNFWCNVADFECSIGIVGTGYWRAPEILKVVKNRTWSTMPNVFTPKLDVYSYAMTCYEIITGFTPFENIEDGETSWEDVMGGKRPKLPKHLKPWVKELMCKCWHMDPSQRPTFEEIVDVLHEARKDHFQSKILPHT